MYAYLLITFLGAGLALLGIRSLNKYRAVRTWERTEGTLTELHTGYAEERIKYTSLKYEYPIVAYEYNVRGQKLTSTRVSVEPKNVWSLLDDARRAPWSPWKKGEKVAVYYDPSNPEDSVLIPQLQPRRRSHLLAVTLSGLLLLLGSIGIAALGA